MTYVPTQCPTCGRRYREEDVEPPRVAVLNGPWPTEAHLYVSRCMGCQARECHYSTTAAPDLTWGWRLADESMQEGRDYDVVHGTHRLPLDGSETLNVIWGFHAMGGNTLFSEWADCRLLDLANGPKRSLIILPAGPRMPWASEAGDEVWRLRPHITADAVGPYPSLRAERSITRTVMPMQAGPSSLAVNTIWPSYRLDPGMLHLPYSDEALRANMALALRKEMPLRVRDSSLQEPSRG